MRGMGWLALLAFLGACQQAPDMALSDGQGNPVAVTYALATYSPEFSRQLAGEVRSAPPGASWPVAIVDYLKLRCQIRPDMQIYKDLQNLQK